MTEQNNQTLITQTGDIFYPVKAPSGRTYSVKRLRVKDQKALMLISEEKGQKDALLSYLKIILNPESNINVNAIPFSDALILLLEARKMSQGDKVDYRVKCKKCGTENDFQVDLNNDLKIIEPELSSFEIDNMKFDFSEISLSNFLMLKDKYEKNQNLFEYYYLLYSIKDVFINKEKIMFKGIEDKENFIDNLEIMKFNKIAEAFAKSLRLITFEKTIKCIKCGEEITISVGDVENFFT